MSWLLISSIVGNLLALIIISMMAWPSIRNAIRKRRNRKSWACLIADGKIVGGL